eukprot:5008772-Karenia_brevis.AAC.1
MAQKHPEIMPKIQDILKHYAMIQHKGIYQTNSDLASLEPCPPPGAPGRKHWKQQGEQGPISLLLQQLHYYAITLHPIDHTIKVNNYPDIQIFKHPYQLIRPQMQQRAIDARNKHAITHRTDLNGMQAVDTRVFNKAIQQQQNITDTKIIRYIATLGAVHESTYTKHTNDKPVLCPYCKQHPASFKHYIWQCQHPTLQQARQQDTTEQQKFILDNIANLPNHMLMGIPHVMSADLNQP